MMDHCQDRCLTTSSDENDEMSENNCMNRCLSKFTETRKIVNEELVQMTKEHWRVCLKQTTLTPFERTLEAQRKLHESPWNSIAVLAAFLPEFRDWDGSDHRLHLNLSINSLPQSFTARINPICPQG